MRKTVTNETYRAAVIGLGRMGSTFDDEIEQGGSLFLPYCHAPSYDAHPRVELVAGADPHDEQRQIFGERWGIDSSHMYADVGQMLAKEDLDLVSICTTARVRRDITVAVAEAGVRGIWLEKPISLSLKEADEMVAACQQHGTSTAINCARRWNPFFGETRRQVDDGELGRLLQVTAYAQCGLSHNGSHAIDTIRYLAAGEVTWVFGEMESDAAAEGEMDLQGNGYLAFDNGVRAYLRALPTGVASWEFDVLGTEGRVRSLAGAIEWEKWIQVAGGPRQRGLPARVPFPWPARMRGMGLDIVDDLLAAIESDSKPRSDITDGRAALEIAIALRESHRQGGQRIDLPLEDRSLRIESAEIRDDSEPARVRRMKAS